MIYFTTIKSIEHDFLASEDPVLTIVPHSFLWGVAFSALGSDEGGRLIDRYALRLAASTAQAVSRKPYHPDIRSALIVANPKSGWSGLTSAQGADRLKLGNNVRVTTLIRDDATEGAVVAGMKNADLVHFSTHGFASAIDPSASSIVLASDPDNDGFMTVGEISQMKLRSRLIFVATCVTGKGVNLGSGPASLGAFISEFGRTAVITATLPLNDQTTRWIEEVFYTKLGEGSDPVVALRDAQLAVKARIPDPSFWAATTYWGP